MQENIISSALNKFHCSCYHKCNMHCVVMATQVAGSYVDEVEDISVDEYSRDTSVWEAYNTDSDADSSANIQAP